MAVRLFVTTSATFDVEETYDQVVDKLFPLTAESSALEARANWYYTKTDGGRVFIPRQWVLSAEELVEDES